MVSCLSDLVCAVLSLLKKQEEEEDLRFCLRDVIVDTAHKDEVMEIFLKNTKLNAVKSQKCIFTAEQVSLPVLYSTKGLSFFRITFSHHHLHLLYVNHHHLLTKSFLALHRFTLERLQGMTGKKYNLDDSD